jgi:hypothetical protein
VCVAHTCCSPSDIVARQHASGALVNGGSTLSAQKSTPQSPAYALPSCNVNVKTDDTSLGLETDESYELFVTVSTAGASSTQ